MISNFCIESCASNEYVCNIIPVIERKQIFGRKTKMYLCHSTTLHVSTSVASMARSASSPAAAASAKKVRRFLAPCSILLLRSLVVAVVDGQVHYILVRVVFDQGGVGLVDDLERPASPPP